LHENTSRWENWEEWKIGGWRNWGRWGNLEGIVREGQKVVCLMSKSVGQLRDLREGEVVRRAIKSQTKSKRSERRRKIVCRSIGIGANRERKWLVGYVRVNSQN
jgi:hypothetical protein